MVEKAESTRAWMMTKEAHDEFKAAVRLATAVELREMFLVSMQAELEAEGRQKPSADDASPSLACFQRASSSSIS